VHTDVHALLDAGMLRRTDDGEIEFPYDTVHVDFTSGGTIPANSGDRRSTRGGRSVDCRVILTA
jgi:hypothetical protein